MGKKDLEIIYHFFKQLGFDGRLPFVILARQEGEQLIQLHRGEKNPSREEKSHKYISIM